MKIKVGNIVRSKYFVKGHIARIGVVVKLFGDDNKYAQVLWPHSRRKGCVKSEDMEVVI